MTKPLGIDLFCGLGGWTEGLLAEGYDVVGFDLERHEYWMPEIAENDGGCKGTRPVEKRGRTQGCAVSLGLEGSGAKPRTQLAQYPAQLVLQDVLTLHGSQFKDAALIVASPPCQEYSYMAMPWSRAKAIAVEYRSGVRDVRKLTALFDACFRIQREACEAAGRHIPMVVENVRGAQKWVGRSRWNFGSFHLWGDVPALMPMTQGRILKAGVVDGFPDGASNFHRDKCNGGRGREGMKVPGVDWHNYGKPGYAHPSFRDKATKVPGFRFDGSGKSFQTASVEGLKTPGRSLSKGASAKFGTHNMGSAESMGSKSTARKAASAAIAKIPFPLAQHIARTWKPV